MPRVRNGVHGSTVLLLVLALVSFFCFPASVQSLPFGSPVTRRTAFVTTVTAGRILTTSSPESIAGATPTGEASAAVPSSSRKEATKFQRYPHIRFIAALGDPKASQGEGATEWGLWRDDPGPRGVWLRNYETQIAKNSNVAPAGWTFDPADWWVEEHGLIMSTPGPLPRKSYDTSTKITLPYKRYRVTGARQVTTTLTVYDNGKWELNEGTLYDVTHLPCRSARYRSNNNSCLPTNANEKNFPVRPEAEMPPIQGCAKQDYAVLFVLGEEVVG